MYCPIDICWLIVEQNFISHLFLHSSPIDWLLFYNNYLRLYFLFLNNSILINFVVRMSSRESRTYASRFPLISFDIALSIINVGSPSCRWLDLLNYLLCTRNEEGLEQWRGGGRERHALIHRVLRRCTNRNVSIIIGVYVTDDWSESMDVSSISFQRGYAKDIEKTRPPETQTRSWDSLDGGHALLPTTSRRLGNKERSISMSFRTSISARS